MMAYEYDDIEWRCATQASTGTERGGNSPVEVFRPLRAPPTTPSDMSWAQTRCRGQRC